MVVKLAILQCCDTGSLESLVVMLRSAGIKCALPSEALKRQLRDLGCDTVLDIDSLVRGMGYEPPMPLPEAGPADMSRSDVLYVDVKAHRSAAKVWKKWPALKMLWYRINGGAPEHVINDRGDHGDEVNPPCPVLTPNQWYKDNPKAYTCWPPFVRWGEYQFERDITHGTNSSRFDPPICLIHNLQGWGYGGLVDKFRDSFGVKCFGAGSPDGLITHDKVQVRLTKALAMVHLKSSDAPGYAIYECLAAGCPLICTRRLIWRCRMEDLLIPGETCLVFDRETHEGLTAEDVASCTEEVRRHLEALHDLDYNAKIGGAGRDRLKQIMWREDRDAKSFKAWINRQYGA